MESMVGMPRVLVELSEEEKKKLEVAKAKSDTDTWREFFLSLIEGKYRESGE